MNDFYKFASESPFLTFFLASMATSAVVSVVKYVTRLIGVLARGQPQITKVVKG